MIYVNRNLKGKPFSNETYISDFGISGDILLKNKDKVFCHIDGNGDVLVETLCPDTSKIEKEVRLFTNTYMERLFTNLKSAEIWRRQLKNLLTVITKSQIFNKEVR
jgi:hypothetical protein